ncbi:MAG: hypothetical protein HUK08_02440 [Bacteroidaceae bacterium]|nr:hypothetical protein [Bacteroidaceae bacterium]
MSKFKWQRLRRYGEKENVRKYLDYGIQRSIYSENLSLDERRSDREIYDLRSLQYRHYLNRQKPLSRFHNSYLRLKMSQIFTKEIHEIDTSIESLALLDIITHFLNRLTEGILSFEIVIEAGLFLQQKGDKVNFVRLEEHISKLYLWKTANLLGTLLVKLFHFSPEEVPFFKKEDSRWRQVVDHYFQLSFEDLITRHHKERAYQQLYLGKHDHSRISAQRGRYYARYHHVEALSSYMANIVNSITQIEE